MSDWLSAKALLDETFTKLQRAVILNRDGIDLLTEYDRAGAFVYCDPPCHQDTRTSTRYSVDMNDSQQEQFIDALLGIRHANVLVSGYDHPLYNHLVDAGWRKEQFVINTTDGTRKKKKKKETLWMNYDAVQMSMFDYLNEESVE